MDWGIFRPSKSASLCLALLGFSFLLMTFRLSGFVKNFRTFLLYWVSPVQQVSTGSLNAVGDFGDKLIHMVKAHKENEILNEALLQASILETQYQELIIENKRLRDLLKLKKETAFKTLSARVSGKDPFNWSHSVWVRINRGSVDFVTVDSPVIAVGTVNDGVAKQVQGLVGKVLETSGRSSKVLLLSDPLSSVAIALPRIGEQGLVQGHGSYITVEYLELTSDAQVGDKVVTSGQGGIFPAGLPVGTITHIEPSPSGFRRAILKPSVSPSSIREVLIMDVPKRSLKS